MEMVPRIGLWLERAIRIVLIHQVLGNTDVPSDFHNVLQEEF